MLKPFTSADAFLLGYLRQRIGVHFGSFDVLTQAGAGAEGELEKRVGESIAGLPLKGPEIVSCVWKIEDILHLKLGAELPNPPGNYQQYLYFSMAVNTAYAAGESAEVFRPAYEVGKRCGLAEQIIAVGSLRRKLWAAAPQNEFLKATTSGLAENIHKFAEDSTEALNGPVFQTIEADIKRELAAAASLSERPAEDDISEDLNRIQFRLGHLARAAESAVRGSARDSIRAWSDKRMDGGELMRRLAEHYLWNVPCRIADGGQPSPRIFSFDKNVLLAFSDSEAYTNRPSFMKSEASQDELFLSMVGTGIFGWVPDDNIDLFVFDATDDQNAPLTINYPREMHSRLRQVGDETAIELAICDWTRVDPAPLRKYQYWIMVAGSSVRAVVVPDGRGRNFVGLFTSETALEAALANSTPELAAEFANCQRFLLDGKTLFPSLAQLDVNGFILNPHGPGRSRAFNIAMLDKLGEVENPYVPT